MGFYIHNLWLGLNLLVFRLTKFFVLIFGARILAPAGFGYFSYLYSLLDIWNSFFGLGLEVTASRAHKERKSEVAKEEVEKEGRGDAETRGRGDAETRGRGDAETRGRGDAETRGRGDGAWVKVWHEAAVARVVLGVMGAAVGFAVFAWPYNLIFGLWHFFFLQSRLAYNFVNTLLYPKGIVIAGFVSQASLAVAAYFGLKYFGLFGFMAGFVVERLVEGLLLWVFTLRRLAKICPLTLPSPARGEGKGGGGWYPAGWFSAIVRLTFKEGGGVIWLSQLLGVLGSRLDTVIVRWLLGYTALASYFIAARAVEAPLFIFLAITDASLAYFIRHPQEQAEHFRKGVKNALFFSLLCAAGIALFGLFAARFVFGPGYPSVGLLMAGCSLVLIPRGLNMVSSSLLLARGREKLLLASLAAGIGLNVAVNFALIPFIGVWAPCLAAIVSESAVAAIRAPAIKSKGLAWGSCP
ncbi:MAG: polysaccharide biosynthesis C-terminal domain-containing protein [Elusimicrobia bacterium]|nr:polysaccharide biosynthesis C-terminal domain-containing protein [Elusimicrobiota bacterium]